MSPAMEVCLYAAVLFIGVVSFICIVMTVLGEW